MDSTRFEGQQATESTRSANGLPIWIGKVERWWMVDSADGQREIQRRSIEWWVRDFRTTSPIHTRASSEREALAYFTKIGGTR